MNLTNKQRKDIYRRDGFRCALCDSGKYLQIHHVIPRGHGGHNHQHNLVTLCSDCHAAAHGIVVKTDYHQDFTNQAICEYLSDYYANLGERWEPWLWEFEDPHKLY